MEEIMKNIEIVTNNEIEELKEISVQLKRIADALEKQNECVVLSIDGKEFSKNILDCKKNTAPEVEQYKPSDEVSHDSVISGIEQGVRNAVENSNVTIPEMEVQEQQVEEDIFTMKHTLEINMLKYAIDKFSKPYNEHGIPQNETLQTILKIIFQDRLL